MSSEQYTIKDEKKLYEEVMSKYKKMNDKTLKKIIHILDSGVEGICMPEFLEFCQHLQKLENDKRIFLLPQKYPC